MRRKIGMRCCPSSIIRGKGESISSRLNVRDYVTDLIWICVHMYDRTDEVDQIIPVEIMLAMLRLGHKYDFERLRNDALRQLKNIFPGNIKACDAQFSDSSTLPIGKFRLLHMSHSFKMIAAAVDLGIETVLPSAYAMVLRHIFGMVRI